MKNKELAQRIKELRVRKGFSQEELADISGLSLRTIQRIENGETEPRGDSLKRLAVAFDVAAEEITDWTVTEDNGLLMSINLSAFSFLFFPVLGILVPLIIWVSKKDKVRKLNDVAKELLNFQITWCIFLFLGYISLILFAFLQFDKMTAVSPSIISGVMIYQLGFFALMYGYNILSISINLFWVKQNKTVRYLPKIKFLRK